MQNDSPASPAPQDDFETAFPPTRPHRRKLLLFIIDHNPCYLLSGLFMLTGCWLLNFALYTKAGDIRKLLLLLLITNLYEFLLIALGLILIKRIAFKRDGRILLALEALFLIDITFTSGILSTIDLQIGLLINAALLILAATKLVLIFRNLNLPHWPRMAAFILAQLTCILLIPTLYKYIAVPHHGRITTLAVYFTWWLTALLPLLAFFLHWLPSKQLLAPPGTERYLCLFFLFLSFASLLVHLYSAAWVYSIRFTPAFLTPLLLGLALFAILLEPHFQRYVIARVQLFFIALSIYYSMNFPSTLLFSLSRGPTLSPLRLTLIATALLFLYFIFHHNNLTYLWTALICLCAAMLGPTLPLILGNLAALSTSSRRLIPRTTLQWGLTSMATSFLLLLIGVLLSLKKHFALHRPTSIT